MTDYVVSDTKLQELNVMINTGGQIPSKVSDNLAGVQKMLAEGEYQKATVYLNRAIAANIESGAAWSDVQGWHDSVKDDGDGGDVGVGPPNPFPNDGVRQKWGPMLKGVKYPTTAGGDGELEWSLTSGAGGVYNNTWVNGTQVSIPCNVKAGDLIEMQQNAQDKGDATGSLVQRPT